MSEKYDEYLTEHKNNVKQAFKWLKENIFSNFNTIFDEESIQNAEYNIVYGHDDSKKYQDEYNAYDEYFYGGNRSYNVVQNFNKAWLKHIHRNSHHWQHWVLMNDEPNEGEIILDMPDEYIIEMISDWWSFSWKNNNLYEIFDWYDKRKNYILLSRGTRSKIESIFNLIKIKLTEKEINNEEV